MQILQTSTKAATQQGAGFLVLNTGVTKVPSYQQAGFKPIGEVFASSSTGLPHLKIQKEI